MTKITAAIQRRPLLFAVGAVALLVIVILVMRHNRQKAIDAQASADAASAAAAAPTSPGYFYGPGNGSGALSDLAGTFGGNYGSGNGDVGSGGGVVDSPLSPAINSTAGVDIGLPVSGGGPPGGGTPLVTDSTVHGVTTQTVVDSNGNVHKAVSANPTATPTRSKNQQRRNMQGIGVHPTFGSDAHPAKSNAPARHVAIHSAGLTEKPKTKARR